MKGPNAMGRAPLVATGNGPGLGGLRGRLARRWRADERASDDGAWTANLAVFRVVFVAAVALPSARHALYWVENVQGRLPEEAWRPLFFFAWVPTSVLHDVPLSRALAQADVGLLLAGLFGVATRWTLGAAALLSAYVLGLPHNQVKVTHDHHVVWFLALLAAGPSGRMLSVDAIVRSTTAARARRPEPIPASPDALPTLRWIWTLFGLVFFATGLVKLHAALTEGWATADVQRAISWSNWLERVAYAGRGPPAERFADLPSWLLATGAWATIAFEIAFFPAVLFRRSRPFAVVAGLAFHAATGALLRIRFRTLVPAYVALVDWAALLSALRRRLRIPTLRAPPPSSPDRPRATPGILRSLDVLQVFGPPVGPPPGAARPRSRALAVVGASLVLGQAVVSGARAIDLRTDPADRGSESARFSRWRWPFDVYPHFTGPRRVDEVQEVRLVLDDGRIVALPPATYSATFGPAAKTAWVLEFAVAEPDAERRRARLTSIVRTLVDHAPTPLRSRAVEAAVVTVTWRVDRVRPVREGEREELRLRVPATSSSE